MSESRTDTDSEPREQDSEDLPGAVSNQNQEEAESGHRGGGEQTDSGSHADATGAGDGEADSSPGAASEGSQATGHPENAG